MRDGLEDELMTHGYTEVELDATQIAVELPDAYFQRHAEDERSRSRDGEATLEQGMLI